MAEWGIVCFYSPPIKVSKPIATTQYRLLRALGLHHNIPGELQMKPKMYQGLAMFDLNANHLGANVYFMQRHWDMSEVMGSILC